MPLLVSIGLGMYVMNLGMFFPYSLLTIGMGVISQECPTNSDIISFFSMNIIFIVIISVLTIRRLKKVDVMA
ncbi:MAG TPA: hypothetical protein VGI33_20155 [Paenibacillus sp.]|jgi:hypothetical protein